MSQSLEQRVSRLERHNRLLTLTWVVAVCGGLFLGLMSASPQDEMTLRKVALVDASGQVRLEIAVGENGRPSYKMLDENGTPRLRMGLHGDQTPALSMHDAKGGIRLLMDASTEPLSDAARRLTEPGASLVLFDEGGERTATIPGPAEH